MNYSYILGRHYNGVGWRKYTLAYIGIVAVLGLLVPLNASAIHQTEEMTWQLIMISSYPACSNYHYQMTDLYHDLTLRYFEAYQFENTSYKPACMTEKKYSDYEIPEDVDLVILVYDRNKGRSDLHSNDMGGFYSHVGDEWTHHHTIVFCDCSNFSYSAPTWILTHELSHFVLYYLGYDRSIVEDLVHLMDAESDYCVEVEYVESCKQSRMNLETSRHRTAVVPVYEPAIGKSPVPLVIVSENISDSPYRMDMQIEVTQWWLDGKITDVDYTKSLEILLEKMGKITKDTQQSFFSAESPNVVFTDPPKNNKLDFTVHSETLDLSSIKSQHILKMHPFGDEYAKSLTNTDSDQLPQWFKTRALWWITGKISEAEYISGMEFMYNSLLPITTEPNEAPMPTNTEPDVPESTQTEPNEAPVSTNTEPDVPESIQTEPNEELTDSTNTRVPYSLVGLEL